MNKIKIKLISLLGIFLITACAYEPIFLQKNYNIILENLNFSGEKVVNKIIENQLSLFRKAEKNDKSKPEVNDKSKPEVNDKAKTYSINLNSELKKVVISKDTTGNPQKFKKILLIKYDVIHEGKIILNKELEKEYIYNNESDKFNLEQTERIIVENLTHNITEMIITSIINTDDS